MRALFVVSPEVVVAVCRAIVSTNDGFYKMNVMTSITPELNFGPFGLIDGSVFGYECYGGTLTVQVDSNEVTFEGRRGCLIDNPVVGCLRNFLEGNPESVSSNDEGRGAFETKGEWRKRLSEHEVTLPKIGRMNTSRI